MVYMESAFDKEAECGEFYLEFGENIWEYKLVERFEAQGACQVNAVTFEHNDGHESASNALLRVLKTQEKTGLLFTKGVRPAGLAKKVQEKLDNSKKDLMSMHEWDEKTKARLDDLKQNMQDVDSKVQSQAIKLEKIENDVQLQAADVVDIKHGVCGVIPDYQKKITNLEEALAHKTKLCDRIEGQKGRLTMEINKLKWEVGELNDKATSLQLQNSQQNKKIQELQEQLDICKSIALLKQTHEELQRTAEILASTLEEERAAKRART